MHLYIFRDIHLFSLGLIALLLSWLGLLNIRAFSKTLIRSADLAPSTNRIWLWRIITVHLRVLDITFALLGPWAQELHVILMIRGMSLPSVGGCMLFSLARVRSMIVFVLDLEWEVIVWIVHFPIEFVRNYHVSIVLIHIVPLFCHWRPHFLVIWCRITVAPMSVRLSWAQVALVVTLWVMQCVIIVLLLSILLSMASLVNRRLTIPIALDRIICILSGISAVLLVLVSPEHLRNTLILCLDGLDLFLSR